MPQVRKTVTFKRIRRRMVHGPSFAHGRDTAAQDLLSADSRSAIVSRVLRRAADLARYLEAVHGSNFDGSRQEREFLKAVKYWREKVRR